MTTQHQIELAQQLKVTIKRLGINGEGIGYYKKNDCFRSWCLTN